VENKVIQITGTGTQSGFSVLMAKSLPNLDVVDKGQCFPRYFYEEAMDSKDKHKKQSHLFESSIEKDETVDLQRRDALTDEGLE
ncbi:type ISP restriction/modification enzyme, partial [Bartonella queenslandensis]|uniref:type ISP restriction/modification enzyme n=1 Tax=Bartonella queenslandensis TaxID=481138 RepID=UPI0005858A56